eukprot:SAG31_NODE_35879_length_318_cov_11.164384_1_plen_34_part_10
MNRYDSVLNLVLVRCGHTGADGVHAKLFNLVVLL